jgi:hypothetical protein
MRRVNREGETSFLNVDLDVWSRRPLEPLVEALGKRIIVHHVGREGRRHGAHVSFSGFGQSADALTRALARLVEKLPEPARTLWDGATAREFNVGIQAGLTPFSHEIRITAETLEMVARLGGTVVVTTYAPEQPSMKANGPKADSRKLRRHR